VSTGPNGPAPPPAEPAGLYLHIPFCSAICPYCDFAVQIARPEARAAFVTELVSEAALWRDWSEPFDTVYLGGGTPSILPPESLGQILSAVRSNLPVLDDARIFLEVNPEDVDGARANDWAHLGVATVSLGVQSFDDAELRWLGRRHDAKQAMGAVRTCIEAGFSTVSVDLIFGLPGQTAPGWDHSLATAAGLEVDHVSCYQLTIHAGTAFGRRRDRGRLTELPENDQAGFFELTHERLARSGYAAYEVSNFAAAAVHRSRHNRKYWRHTPYLGLGPSAHSFDGQYRWWNVRGPHAYRDRVANGQRPIEGSEKLSNRDLALETLMLSLRTTEGIDLDAFRRRFGHDLAAVNLPLIAELETGGYLQPRTGRHLAPTIAGLAIADGLAARFEI